MSVCIKTATIDDAAQISGLINLCVINQWTTLYPVTIEEEIKYIEELREREAIFIALVEDVFAGFASISQVNSWSDRYNHCAIGGTWVFPRFLGKGVSKKLWREGVFPFGEDKGILHYSHTVPVSNIRAIRHYESLGFRICGYLRDYIQWGNDVFEDVMLMEYSVRKLSNKTDTMISCCGLDCSECDLMNMLHNDEAAEKALNWFKEKNWLVVEDTLDDAI